MSNATQATDAIEAPKGYNEEYAHTLLGVEGRMFRRIVRDAAKGTFHNQKWCATRYYEKSHYRMVVEIRFDDDCGNGHNSFAITCDMSERERLASGREYWRDVGGGAAHDEIARVFPELAPLIKWHLSSTDGPLHYVANTMYHAGDRDCWGLRKGEVRQIVNGRTKLPCWILEAPRTEYRDAEVCPEGTVTLTWKPLNKIGEGKERNLDGARSCAVWPEATDEELCADDLKEKLIARLSALLAEFKDTITAIGFDWEAK